MRNSEALLYFLSTVRIIYTAENSGKFVLPETIRKFFLNYFVLNYVPSLLPVNSQRASVQSFGKFGNFIRCYILIDKAHFIIFPIKCVKVQCHICVPIADRPTEYKFVFNGFIQACLAS